MIWLYIVVGGFAILGVWTFVRGIVAGSKRVMDTTNNLVNTLKDATEIARAYREDLSVLRQIAQSGSQAPNGDEPESIIPQQPQAPATMPPPLWSRFTIKPDEPDAPPEAIADVDVTANEEETVEQERNEQASDFEAQERQKAATREADHERLVGLGINEKPEGQ